MYIFALDKKFLHFFHEKWVDACEQNFAHSNYLFLYECWNSRRNVYNIIYLDFLVFCAIHIWELANNLYEWMLYFPSAYLHNSLLENFAHNIKISRLCKMKKNYLCFKACFIWFSYYYTNVVDRSKTEISSFTIQCYNAIL